MSVSLMDGKIRFMYLKTVFIHPYAVKLAHKYNKSPESFYQERGMEPQLHPHTCVAIRLDAESNSIHFAVARRESPGRLISLKQRVCKIRELGGIPGEALLTELRKSHKNFTKLIARTRACRRLNRSPRVIENVDLAALTVHDLSRLVMTSIANGEEIISEDGEMADPYYVRAAAEEWLTRNTFSPESLSSRATLPDDSEKNA